MRVLVHEQLQQYSLQAEIETRYGKFYADDGMLMLQSGSKLSAWSIETMDFGAELTPAEIQETRDYYAQVAKDHEDYLVQCAENEYERRIDEYFSGS